MMSDIDYVVAEIIINVTAAGVIASLAFIFRNTIISYIKSLLPRLNSKTPHVNFEVKNYETEDGSWESVVLVSNAGDEPAYNVCVFYFEQFPDGNFKIHMSDADVLISRPVLGIRDSLEFKTSAVHFDGCNVTCRQEIWVEYENSASVNFRVVSHPPSPIGDIGRIMPPKVIKYRLDQIPGMPREGSARLCKKYEKGKVKPIVKKRRLKNLLWKIKYNLYITPKYKLKDWYNRIK